MKITLNVEDGLLKRAMEALGTENKTYAIDLALREVCRKHTLRTLGQRGLGLTSAELKKAVDPAYELMTLRVAETPVKYGRKTRSRR
ncbi:MAG: type II toxin-antitoxin system VapB family antitoxin [Candidatus Methylacidiphilales bacterium]|nr:type II toxin-antitoxin system VapB family antitoxin [Candidatus Methylacidiphilales bacterium]